MLRRLDETSDEKAPHDDLQAALRDAVADANLALARIAAIRRRLHEQSAGTHQGDGAFHPGEPTPKTAVDPVLFSHPGLG